jgi:sulfite exporter TauE/SafE
MNLWLVFLTGLTTGGLSCLAMQGGLLASVITNQKDDELETSKDRASLKPGSFDSLDWLPVTMFLGSKLVIHTLFGFLLGALGSVISLSLGVRLAFQIFTAFFMLATAMNLLNVHPIFRYVMFQPPRFIRKWIRGSTKSKALFAPAVLGLLTVFIPCGVTQAMEITAINSGSAVNGALIMFAFVLGTSPLFALIGVAAAKLSETWNQRFLKAAAYGLVVMSIWGLNGVLVVMDSPVTLQKMSQPVTGFFSAERFAPEEATANVIAGVQKVEIQAVNAGYQPRYFKVKAGQPVELTVSTNETHSCAAAFTFKAFKIATFLGPTDSKTFTFTPTQKGKYTYACSMGMYTGTMEVI